MSAVALDTLKFTKRLREAGVPDKQAEAEAEAVHEALREIIGDFERSRLKEVATKQDIKALEASTKLSINELDAKIETVRDTLSRDIKALEASTKQDFKALEATNKLDIKELDAKIETVRDFLRRDIKESALRLEAKIADTHADLVKWVVSAGLVQFALIAGLIFVRLKGA
jgi:hypothetical protein